MRLPDPARSHAVLIGTSRYRSPLLPDLPAVAGGVRDLASALTHPHRGGFAPGRCATLEDPDSARTAYRALRRGLEAAEDTALVYLAGHGLVGDHDGELHLALPDTDPDELGVSALPFALVRALLRDCPAANRVLVLDCCFSGRATGEFMSAVGAHAERTEIAGTWVLASAPANAVALAPAGARHTSFTGALIELLRDGVPDGPELLTLDLLYRSLRRTMRARGHPLPTRRGTETADQLALARNPARARPAPPPLPPRRPARPRVLIPAAAIAAGIAAAGAAAWFYPDSPRTGGAATSSSPVPTTTAQGSSIVRVYNNSALPDQAGRLAQDLTSRGWQATAAGDYTSGVIPSSTVYYGDATEQPAAQRLAEEFHLRVEPRFHGIEDAPPGLIVIVTKDYGDAPG